MACKYIKDFLVLTLKMLQLDTPTDGLFGLLFLDVKSVLNPSPLF